MIFLERGLICMILNTCTKCAHVFSFQINFVSFKFQNVDLSMSIQTFLYINHRSEISCKESC